MREKLRIRFVVFEKALAMQILSQPEEWRGEVFQASNGISIRVKNGYPNIHLSSNLELRGNDLGADYAIAQDYYLASDTRIKEEPEKTRDKMVAAITEFVAHKDGRKPVDVRSLTDEMRRLKRGPVEPSSSYSDLTVALNDGIELAIGAVKKWAATTTPPTPDANGVYEW